LELRRLQIELVKLQRHAIETDLRILVILEGRDAAGKDGTIKRIVENLSPRETRVVALGKPTERDRSSWYFQRWVTHLPAGEELVLFNRSWYNRAGVERVMGFCTEPQVEEFMEVVGTFEGLLVRSGIRLFKFYLDISRDEQIERLRARAEDPLKQWKISPIDARATELWDEYGAARNEMLERTHSDVAPWHVIRADRKKPARINLMRDLLSRIDYAGKDSGAVEPDPDVAFRYSREHVTKGRIAP